MIPETITVLLAGTTLPRVDPGDGPIVIIGRVATGDDAVEHVVAELPDVLLLDAGIGGPEGRAVCRRVREWAPATRVLAVVDRDDEHAYTLVVAGSSGIVSSSLELEEVAPAVVGIARGESLLSPRVARRLLHDIDAWAARSADPLHPPPTLTATEREVLTRLGGGCTPARIAADYAVTARLVNLHTGYAVAKLQRYVLGAERIAADS